MTWSKKKKKNIAFKMWMLLVGNWYLYMRWILAEAVRMLEGERGAGDDDASCMGVREGSWNELQLEKCYVTGMEKNWQVPTRQDSTAHVLLSVRFVFLVIFLHSGRCYRHVPRLLLLTDNTLFCSLQEVQVEKIWFGLWIDNKISLKNYGHTW